MKARIEIVTELEAPAVTAYSVQGWFWQDGLDPGPVDLGYAVSPA